MRALGRMRPGWPRSLSARLSLLAIATLVPLSGLTVYSHVEDLRESREAELQEAVEYSRSVAASIDSFAQGLESLTLAAALSVGNREGPINNATSQPFLKALSDESGLLRAVFVTDLDGKVLAQSVGDDTGRDLSGRPYVQELRSGQETVWSAGLEGVDSGQITVAYGRVIHGPGNQPVGYLIVAFYPAVLSERLPQPDRGNIVLIDQRGKLLRSSADPERPLEAPTLSDDPDVAAALRGESVTLRGRTTAFDDGSRFGAITPIPTMDWALAYTRSQSRLDAALRNAFVRDMLVLVVIGAASTAALLIVARQVSRPLSSLAAAVSDIPRGEFPAILKPATDPDIARLQDAFTTLQGDVHRRERDLMDQARVMTTLEQAGHLLASDLDFGATVQAVTDAGVRVTEAAFGALFYNTVTPEGESYQLFTLSGVDRSQFEGFGMPRNTGIFGTTFRGEATLRLDDVTTDPRFGNNPPYRGMPPGHLPVRSYLALPVMSRDGSVWGGLFFGHPEPARFTERHEELAMGIASWASIALDNARMFEAATQREAELAKANAAKDEFLGLVSHELRTPITIIAGASNHLIEHKGQLDPTSEDLLLRDVRDSASRLSQLVHNMLMLARLDRLETEAEPVLLRLVITGAADELRARAPFRQLLVRNEDPAALVLGSTLYVEQVLGNLLSNAHKYTPETEPIELNARRDGSSVVITVRDHGPGLSDEDAEHLFEPYYRGREARRKATGFGLGLAVCRALAGAMGGTLSASRAEGGGAQFELRLPRMVELAPEEVWTARPNSAAAGLERA